MKSPTLTQARRLQDLAAQEFDQLANQPIADVDTRIARASALRNLASVWEMSVERVRILYGKPLPGSLRPTKPKPVKRRPQEPMVESATEPAIEAPEPAPASPTPHPAAISPIEPSEG